MKFLVVFAGVIVAINAATDLEIWEHFKKTHSKNYKDAIEERDRFSVFQNNLRDIEEHNTRYNNGIETYYMGINKFADWTNEEFRKFLTFKIPSNVPTETFVRDPNFIAPDSIDWREKGAVLEVKDQGDCGGSFAFTVTGAIEGQNAIKHNQTISLSEQELIDCSIIYDNHGCDGGVIEYGFHYTELRGIATEKDYPYTGTDDTCKSTNKSGIEVTSHVKTISTEQVLTEAVASVGPISVAINADLIQFYEGGIFNQHNCSKIVSHAMLAVGYGIEGRTPFWILKNSWGTGWGEDGYFRIIRLDAQQCAIGSYNVYPIIE